VREEHFTVDAALLRELGERLVGRPEIALAELIKNAHDADALSCELTIKETEIVVADNGHGMTADEFRRFYLRIASQDKANRTVSRELGRPLTGSKGVGRLAAQFLGRRLKVRTRSKSEPTKMVVATMDWSSIVPGQELSSFPVNIDEPAAEPSDTFPDGRTHGTIITISDVWAKLTETEFQNLGREIWSLRSPYRYWDSDDSRSVSENGSSRTNFDVRLFGVDERKESEFNLVLEELTRSLWRARVVGEITDGRDSDKGRITIEFKSGYPPGSSSRTYRDEVRLSELKWLGTARSAQPRLGSALLNNVKFVIHVFRLERQQSHRVKLEELRGYLEDFGGVAIYDADFRLPYYGLESDWLENGADQAKRLSTSAMLPSKWNLDGRYMLDLPEPRRILGWVEVDTNKEARAGNNHPPSDILRIQVGRDRLIDNAAYRQLQAFVRYGIDLYANRYRARIIGAGERLAGAEPPQASFRKVKEALEEFQDQLPQGDYNRVYQLLTTAETTAAAVDRLAHDRAVALAPFAAAGLTALGLTHELAREARVLEGIKARLERLAARHQLEELSSAAKEIGASLERLTALQGLFAPLLSEDDRAGENRLRVQPIVQQVASSMQPLTPGLIVEVNVDEEMRFPAAPLAAWSAIFQNALANSWNASLASREARVRIDGGGDGKLEWVRISDRGVGIKLADAERLFEAFERGLKIAPEHKGVALGGHGMGLAIVRLLCGRFNCRARFIPPLPGFATTLQIDWRA
jgi:signal transduction histidine kinase